MGKFIVTAGVLGALAATTLGCAGSAAAAPTGAASAGDTVKSLQAQGYNVQINGSVTSPLSECLVTGVHGPGEVHVVLLTANSSPGIGQSG